VAHSPNKGAAASRGRISPLLLAPEPSMMARDYSSLAPLRV
jgi:hypothetical protein